MDQLGFPLYGQEFASPATFRHELPNSSGYSPFYANGHEITLQHRPSAWKVATSLSPLMGALGQVADAMEESKEAAPASAAPASAPLVATTAGVALVAGVVAFGLLVRGAAGYFAGKAMAPDKTRESKYAWGGVFASVLFGTLGLGVEGAIALSNK